MLGRLRRRPTHPSTILAAVDHDSHKYSRGVVGIIAGSKKYPGAALLCVGGARRGGAGYVKCIASTELISTLIYSSYPDVVQVPSFKNEGCDAIVMGPGSPQISSIPKGVPLVLDGPAIAAVNSQRNPITVLTPHEGELKYLGYTLAGREETVQKIANELNAIVVLKGRKTLVAAPYLPILIDDIGGVELATAGSGDILAGLIGSMLASWKPKNLTEAQKVTFLSVQYHSLAGVEARKRKNPVVATDILEALPIVNL
jgi:hydroxyethylthiazole kinase-like uncharacterized protein yjeF